MWKGQTGGEQDWAEAEADSVESWNHRITEWFRLEKTFKLP